MQKIRRFQRGLQLAPIEALLKRSAVPSKDLKAKVLDGTREQLYQKFEKVLKKGKEVDLPKEIDDIYSTPKMPAILDYLHITEKELRKLAQEILVEVQRKLVKGNQ